MRRVLLVFFVIFITVLSLASPNEIEATSHVTVTHNPPDLFSGGRVSVKITGSNAFNPALPYMYRALYVATGEGGCFFEGLGTVNSPDELITSDEPLSNCQGQVGEWTFQLWQGSKLDDRKDYRNIIVSDYRYYVQQSGGGVPQIEPLQSPLVVGQRPSVILKNARGGNSYTFWWSEAKVVSIAVKAPNDGNFVLPLITETAIGIDFGPNKTVKLCMEIGSSRINTTGLTCRFSTEFTFLPVVPTPTSPQCKLVPENPGNDIPISIKASGLTANTDYRVTLTSSGSLQKVEIKNSGTTNFILFNLGSNLPDGPYNASIFDASNQKICEKAFNITGKTPLTPVLLKIPPFNPTKCAAGDTDCQKCVVDETKPQGVPTAVGCIPTNLAGFVGKIFAIILGLAGGIALLLIIYSGYRMVTEGSNPESLQGARETLTSAIVGLLFVIFSFVILEVIGVDILRIPGFGRETVKTPGGEVIKDCFDVRYAIKNIKECGNDTLTLACRGLRNDIEDIYDRGQTPTNQQLDLEKQCKDEGF